MYIYFPKDENDRYHGSIHNPLSNRASQVFDMHVQFQKLLVIHLSTKFDVLYDIEHHGEKRAAGWSCCICQVKVDTKKRS